LQLCYCAEYFSGSLLAARLAFAKNHEQDKENISPCAKILTQIQKKY
jgi:hypothetical protein